MEYFDCILTIQSFLKSYIIHIFQIQVTIPIACSIPTRKPQNIALSSRRPMYQMETKILYFWPYESLLQNEWCH